MRERDAVSDWLVERLAAGDLRPEEARGVRARLEARGELDRLARIELANRDFLAAHPPHRVTAEIERRARAQANDPVPTRASRVLRFAAPAIAIAAVLVIWLARHPGAESSHVPVETDEIVRFKGHRPHLVLYKKTTSGAVRLSDRARVRAGDTVQVAYVAAGQQFGVIASIDGRGSVTLHMPEDSGDAIELVGQGEAPLPHAFVLDDSPGFERFFFITSDRVFSTSVVLDALRSPPFPAHLSITDITLNKESP